MKNLNNNTIGQWAAVWQNQNPNGKDKPLDISDLKNQDNYKAYHNTWEKLNEMQEIEQFDTDTAWNKLHNSIKRENIGSLENTTPSIFRKPKYWMIAASVALLAAISAVWVWNQNIETVYANTDTVSVKEVRLPDGSNVFLNTNSQLSFRTHKFNKETRTVTLTGEAFFEVTPDKECPFIVASGNAFVKVLGTSFIVKNILNQFNVVVKTGKIGVFSNPVFEHGKMLIAGEAAQILTNGIIEKSINTDENYLSWQNKKLVFKAQSLSQVIVDIQNTYHCKIILADTNSNNLKMTATYNNAHINDVMESISVAFNLKAVSENGSYLLTPN